MFVFCRFFLAKVRNSCKICSFKSVILSWICHSGPNFSYLPEFVVLDWIRHFWINFSFWGEYVCHSLLNFLFWAKFINQDCNSHSGMNLLFLAVFILLGVSPKPYSQGSVKFYYILLVSHSWPRRLFIRMGVWWMMAKFFGLQFFL